jgi:hypothetical protein
MMGIEKWLSVVLATLAISLASSQRAIAQAGEGDSVRAMTIGNSFAENAFRYLKAIATDGGVNLEIGTANLGGCTLERHARLARQFEEDASERPYTRSTADGKSKLSLQEYLAADNWDFVTIQQQSALSYQPESYHPYVEELVQLVREYAPQAEILIHQTWAYRPDSPYLHDHDLTQEEMYRRLSRVYADVADQFGARIIPVGTAFQRARNTEGRKVVVPDAHYDFDNPVFPHLPDQTHSLVAGWYWEKRGSEPMLKLDFKHANAGGCYLAGLVWYETITGRDARKIQFVPKGIQPDDAAFYRKTAHEVVSEQRAKR